MAQSTQKSGQQASSSASLEGGKGEVRNPDAASPYSEKPRNSSGAASAAASVLDLRQKVNFLLECVEVFATSLGDTQVLTDCKRIRQQGFRGPRGTR